MPHFVSKKHLPTNTANDKMNHPSEINSPILRHQNHLSRKQINTLNTKVETAKVLELPVKDYVTVQELH